jgi:predicted dehydrogenase
MLVPASAVGRDGPAPSERTTVGHIGCGCKGGYRDVYYGSLLQEFVGNPGVRSLAVCDVDGTARDRAKAYVDQQYGNRDCAAYNDFRAVLARGDIDAVVIATPEHWHGVQAVLSCRAGKDVYCEKPLALTVRESRAIVTAARRYGRVVQTGSQSRSMPRLRHGCEVVRSGRIGRVKLVYAQNWGQGAPANPLFPPEPVPSYLDWDLWLGPAPWRPCNRVYYTRGWIDVADFSGGGMTDWGAHHFDLAQWGLGKDHTGPVEVFPPGHDGLPGGVSFRYADGVVVVHNGGGDGVTFFGERGKVWLKALDGLTRFEPAELAREPLPPELRTTGKGHVQNFVDCVQSRARPNADVEIGCRSATVCHLGNICYNLRRPLRWDPEQEQFAGDAEANRLLHRPLRGPWVL